jgi:hypothetical protein
MCVQLIESEGKDVKTFFSEVQASWDEMWNAVYSADASSECKSCMEGCVCLCVCVGVDVGVYDCAGMCI